MIAHQFCKLQGKIKWKVRCARAGELYYGSFCICNSHKPTTTYNNSFITLLQRLICQEYYSQQDLSQSNEQKKKKKKKKKKNPKEDFPEFLEQCLLDYLIYMRLERRHSGRKSTLLVIDKIPVHFVTLIFVSKHLLHRFQIMFNTVFKSALKFVDLRIQ